MTTISERDDEEEAEGYDAALAETPLQLAKAESRAVWCLRLATLFVLFLTATIICWIILEHEADSQQEAFETAFDTHAAQILSAVEKGSILRYNALDSFSQDVTSFAQARKQLLVKNPLDTRRQLLQESSGNTSTTFLNIPDYARKAFSTVQSAGVIGLIWTPVVSSEELLDWNTYSVEHSDWIAEDQSFLEEKGQALADSPLLSTIAAAQQGVQGLDRPSTDDIPPAVFGWDGSGAATLANASSNEESYMPVWQFYPAPADPSLVNCDMLSYPFYAASLRTVVEKQDPILLSRAYVAGNWFPAKILQMLVPDTELTANDGPISNLYIPIYDKYQKENRNVVGVLTSHLIWKSFFENTLPLGSPAPLTVVLVNNCGQNYTFEVKGVDSTFVGVGDLHSESHDHMVTEGKFNLMNQEEPNSDEEVNAKVRCEYGIRIYPTQALEDEYINGEPLEFVFFLSILFLFTTGAFLMYDCIVQRRHRLVMKKATEQTAVVSSLFPQAVREALPSILAKKDDNKANEKTFRATQHASAPYTMDDSVPVADLYPNCTVLFCDIAGFTAWSSQREPTAVFKLLETMYGAFDKIAEKRGVFKIETIGDCYVAVTGLPNPQERHAIIMSYFAADCMLALSELMPLLVAKLGPDTENLAMRFGLHSGPVTAGVLRGARARFQLFGDTVNTAARMESTGQKGRIQVSQATADILTDAGKAHWLTKRAERVEAKGKGSLQTYFVMPTSSGTRTTRSTPEANEARQYQEQFKTTMDTLRVEV